MSLNKLVESYLKSSHRTTPVRSPFSQSNYYSSNYVTGGSDSWLDLTDLYNTTYKTHHMEEGFNKVMYNEPLNIMVMWPKDDAEGFDHIDEECVAQFGLKTARGYRKDYRFLDQSIPGAGKVAISEEQADQLISDTFKSLREVRPNYTRNVGETPVERIDESQRKFVNRRFHKLIQEEIDKQLHRKYDIGLTEKEKKEARKLIRRMQLDEDLTKFTDALADVCSKQLREGDKISETEAKLISKATKRNE